LHAEKEHERRDAYAQ